MNTPSQIPVFNLFGETSAFPDVVHHERVIDRAGLHEWVISAHRHAAMSQVFLIERGRAVVTVDGREITLNDAEYLYVPPQVVHGFQFSRGTEGAVLSIPTPVLSRLGPKHPLIADWLSAPRQGTVSEEILDRVGAIARTFKSAGIFRTQRLVAQTHDLIALLAEEGLAQGPSARDPNRQMQALDALVAAHLGDGWTARDYAGALHITTGHLNRIVRTAAGMPLSAYLESAVMTEACRLIAFTRMPIAEIGARLGYDDPPYFSRRFRLRMGETPSDYRSRVSGEAA